MLALRKIAVHYHLEYPDFLVDEARKRPEHLDRVPLDHLVERLRLVQQNPSIQFSVSDDKSDNFRELCRQRGLKVPPLTFEVQSDIAVPMIIGGAHIVPGSAQGYLPDSDRRPAQRLTGCPIEFISNLQYDVFHRERPKLIDLSLCSIHRGGSAYRYKVYRMISYEIFSLDPDISPFLADRHLR